MIEKNTYMLVNKIPRNGIKYPKAVQQAFNDFDKASKRVETTEALFHVAEAKRAQVIKAQDDARIAAARAGQPNPYDQGAIDRATEAQQFATLTRVEARKQLEAASAHVIRSVNENAAEVIPAAAHAYLKASDRLNKAIEGYATEYAAWKELVDGFRQILTSTEQCDQARRFAPEATELRPPVPVNAAEDKVINSILNPKPVEPEPVVNTHRKVNVFL